MGETANRDAAFRGTTRGPPIGSDLAHRAVLLWSFITIQSGATVLFYFMLSCRLDLAKIRSSFPYVWSQFLSWKRLFYFLLDLTVLWVIIYTFEDFLLCFKSCDYTDSVNGRSQGKFWRDAKRFECQYVKTLRHFIFFVFTCKKKSFEFIFIIIILTTL